jgi:GR25 family glycosyltransferase involved in LPS biosynthesis
MGQFPIAAYFCITLDHRRDRRRHFLEQIERTRDRWPAPIQENVRAGVWYGSFSEIGGDIPPLARYLKERRAPTQLGTIGCYHAHVRVLEEIALQHTDRWFVVFEDDVWIRSADWLKVLGGMRLPCGNESSNLVFVDPAGEPRAEDRIEGNWFRISRTFPDYWGAHCYVVLGPPAARKVLERLRQHPFMEDIDGIMARHPESLAWYPRVMGVKRMGSDRDR